MLSQKNQLTLTQNQNKVLRSAKLVINTSGVRDDRVSTTRRGSRGQGRIYRDLYKNRLYTSRKWQDIAGTPQEKP